MSERRSKRWPYIRKLAYERDRKARAVCHICGERIDYTIKPSSAPLAWEPDHIQPFSRAPELELDLNNIKASHMRCNRQRGNGNNDGNLGQRSRLW